MSREFNRWIGPLRDRVRLMVGRAVITGVDDGPMAQELQIEQLHDERHDGVEHFQGYGFTAHPLVGAEAVTVAIGGNRSHQMVVAIEDRRHRPTGLQPGEAMLYDDQGQRLKLRRDGVEIHTPLAATIAAEGDVAIAGANVNMTSEGELQLQSAEPATIQAPAIALEGPTTITPPLPPGSGGTGVDSLAALRLLLGVPAAGEAQAADATLGALADLDATAGLVEQTGPDAFAKRPIGAGAAGDILSRAHGDARYAAAAHTHALADIAGLIAALAAKLDDSQASAYGLTILAAANAAAAKALLALVKGDVGLGNVDDTADAAKNVLTATKLAVARNINGVAFDGSAPITINAVDSTARIASSEKAANNGVATLDSGGKVPAAQLPSYVDDVLEYADLASFPPAGETGKIFIALDTSKPYRWTGSVYVEISPSPGSTDSVTEGSTNLYFTEARVRATAATGLADTAGTPAAGDSILTVLGKIKKAFFTDHAGAGGGAHANAVAAGAAGFMTGADKSKLDGVAAGSTANDTDANLKARANHTGTQPVSTVLAAATARFFGRISALGGAGEELTGTQATSLLDVFTGLLKGLVPSGGDATKLLRGDATWFSYGSMAAQAANAVAITGGAAALTTGFSYTFTQNGYTVASVTNASAGASARVGWAVNTNASFLGLEAWGTGYGASGGGDDVADGARLFWNGAGGMAIRASGGSIRFYVGSALLFAFDSHFGDFANDLAAAAGGVPQGHAYRNGSAMMVRVA